MAESTKIQWCDHTFNPWIGCSKVSPGCANCYAEARDQRFAKGKHWGKGAPRQRTSAANWKQPLHWARFSLVCDHCGTAQRPDEGCVDPLCDRHHRIGSYHRPRVFCASLADWLDDEVPIAWLADLLQLIHDTPNLDWLLLTKRPQNWSSRLRAILDDNWQKNQPGRRVTGWFHEWVAGWLHARSYQWRIPANIWIGTSVEDQKRADERIPELLSIPAKVRFLSVEPMLGPITFPSGLRDQFAHGLPKIHWVIFGGESGPNARRCNIDWIRNGIKQCRAAGIAPFVKQLGAKVRCGISDKDVRQWPHWREQVHQATDYCHVRLNDPKGGDPAEWPADSQVREFPTPRSARQMQ